MSTHISQYFFASLFCTIQAVCFCVLSTIGFSSCFLLFMRVNYRLAILFSFLRRFNGVFSAFDSLVVCLYGLGYRGLYGVYLRSNGFCLYRHGLIRSTNNKAYLYIVVVIPCTHYILICYILILYVVVAEYVTTTYSPQTKLINSVNQLAGLI